VIPENQEFLGVFNTVRVCQPTQKQLKYRKTKDKEDK